MGQREDCDRRLQAQIKEPLAVNRARRTIAYLDSVARFSESDRNVVCSTMSKDHKDYVELRAAYLESRKATASLTSAIKEKNNEH